MAQRKSLKTSFRTAIGYRLATGSTICQSFPCLQIKFLKESPSSMKQNSPNHRTHRTVARKAAHRKGSKQTSQDMDLNQLIERLTRLRFGLQSIIIDASN